MNKDIIRRVQTAECVLITFVRGEGLDESDPVREVMQVYSMQGHLLAENDPHPVNGSEGLTS